LHRYLFGWFVLAVASLGCRRSEEPPASEQLFNLAAMKQSQPAAEPAWPLVTNNRSFAFPQDHAAHPDYRIEWWYYTGNLDDAAGNRFGFQLTFFRSGIRQQPASQSVWALRDLYTAHFAISDVSQKRHFVFQRNNRRGVGWAGALTDRCEVWNGDWRLAVEGLSHHLIAEDGECALDLTLTPTKPAALHGDQGLSRKGASNGNASYYYSLSRMLASGTLCVGGRKCQVNGTAWMDHEFSSSFLEPGQTGWDWFAIQLDNGFDLMLYRVRRADGAPEPCSSGSLIAPDGSVTHLSSSDFKLSSDSPWKSVDTDASYPLRWLIDIPKIGYRLEVTAAFPDQEMVTAATTGLNYWEGAIDIRGDVDGRPARGRGYMELTGYGSAAGKNARLPFQSPSKDEATDGH
jgi:predicted secreted hydrolase